ncbi:MAG: hypothetical protein U5L04_11640 [Trueperaceae bacterium]|nr:hypothetical protein [Trueperaceae bacterium]
MTKPQSRTVLGWMTHYRAGIATKQDTPVEVAGVLVVIVSGDRDFVRRVGSRGLSESA